MQYLYNFNTTVSPYPQGMPKTKPQIVPNSTSTIYYVFFPVHTYL